MSCRPKGKKQGLKARLKDGKDSEGTTQKASLNRFEITKGLGHVPVR